MPRRRFFTRPASSFPQRPTGSGGLVGPPPTGIIAQIMSGSISTNQGNRVFGATLLDMQGFAGKDRSAARTWIAEEYRRLERETPNEDGGSLFEDARLQQVQKISSMPSNPRCVPRSIPALANNQGAGTITTHHCWFPNDMLMRVRVEARDTVPLIKTMDSVKCYVVLHFSEEAPLQILRMANIQSPHVISTHLDIVEGRFRIVTPEYREKHGAVRAAFDLILPTWHSDNLPRDLLTCHLIEAAIKKEKPQAKGVVAVDEPVEEAAAESKPQANVRTTVRLGGIIKLRKK